MSYYFAEKQIITDYQNNKKEPPLKVLWQEAEMY
jgi:hypothetical protein